MTPYYIYERSYGLDIKNCISLNHFSLYIKLRLCLKTAYWVYGIQTTIVGLLQQIVPKENHCSFGFEIVSRSTHEITRK